MIYMFTSKIMSSHLLSRFYLNATYSDFGVNTKHAKSATQKYKTWLVMTDYKTKSNQTNVVQFFYLYNIKIKPGRH